MIAAVAYVFISVLLIAAAMLLFLKALQMFRMPAPFAKRSLKPRVGVATRQVDLANDRQEIVEMLERQFHSSPSTDL
ncbi:hypothetical protein [Thalassoporum mexicanum]